MFYPAEVYEISLACPFSSTAQVSQEGSLTEMEQSVETDFL